MEAEFVYLAVILDGFSRKVVGWALDRTLASRLTIAALEHATAQRRPRPGLVHHSDRGLQYACGEYVAILEKYGMVPSMSRPANPYDNASCESFMKMLKREEIYANQYDDLSICGRTRTEVLWVSCTLAYVALLLFFLFILFGISLFPSASD